MKKLNVNLILNELEKKFFEFFFFKEWCNIVAPIFGKIIHSTKQVFWKKLFGTILFYDLLMRGKGKKDNEGQYIQVKKRGKGGLRFSGTTNQPDIHRN